MTRLKVYNQEGKEVEKIDIDKRLFDGSVNNNLLYQVVIAYQANARRGRHSTKTRADVSGGGKKPWRQKGTGRARVGSNRSPLWRHGGVIFGPHPRSYNVNLSSRIRSKALQSSINTRIKEDALVILDNLDSSIHKTKEFNMILRKLKLTEHCLLVLDNLTLPLFKAARNIPFISIKASSDVNALDVLASKKILMTKKTLTDLSNRLNKSIG